MDHWPRHARQWALVGPPLRPCADDVRATSDAIAAWARAHRRPPRALVLGVTPELVAAPWPDGARVTAIDHGRATIAALFAAAPGRDVVCADWSALPIRARTIDLVAGDGVLSCVGYPHGYRALAAELGRVLADDARVIVRLFATPPRAESLADVRAALAWNAIGSFHALKWRLAMAIAPADRNLRVADLHRAFAELVPDRAALADRTGWPRAVIDAIDVYDGSRVVYSFPTEAEAIDALAEDLVVVDRHAPAYELGGRCPTIVLQARRAR